MSRETNTCKRCNNCRKMADELMCDNEESEAYGLSVAEDDYCEEFECTEEDDE